MTILTPTPEQEAILAAAAMPSNLFIIAYAGTGKTTTLKLLASHLPIQRTLALAFNVKNKKDFEKAFPEHFDVKTLNGLGHSVWGQAIGKRCEVDDRKLGRLLSQHLKAHKISATEGEWAETRQLVTFSMQEGIVPQAFSHNYRGLTEDTKQNWIDLASKHFLSLTEDQIAIARKVLEASVREAFQGKISYDDQIYMSAVYAPTDAWPKYPLVFVDEAQDLSSLNHIQLSKVASQRLIVVGDPKQAIYAFRGASSNSMGQIKALRPSDSWMELPLATTFRCPHVVVGRQQSHAIGFKCAPSAPQGHFQNLWSKSEAEGKTWDWPEIEAIAKNYIPKVHPQYAVICRNNAPLLKLAFKLLRQNISCAMLGRDIGKGLISLAKKIILNPETEARDCISLINKWREDESSKARINEQEEKLAGIEDRAECLLAVLDGGNCGNAAALYFALEALFSREHGVVTLASGHKSKGMEYDLVIHLDPWRIPSKYAKRAAAEGHSSQLEQELNLKYVIETRAKLVLVEANVADFV
jgi:DNA helicase II / ATP-dependent DNA helicase PcrA